MGQYSFPPLSGERASYAAATSFCFQAEDGIRDGRVTGVQTCALPISRNGVPEVEEQGGHRSRPQGHRSGEPSGEFGGGIGEWREEHGVVAMSGEPRRGSAGHRSEERRGGKEWRGRGGADE